MQLSELLQSLAACYSKVEAANTKTTSMLAEHRKWLDDFKAENISEFERLINVEVDRELETIMNDPMWMDKSVAWLHNKWTQANKQRRKVEEVKPVGLDEKVCTLLSALVPGLNLCS